MQISPKTIGDLSGDKCTRGGKPNMVHTIGDQSEIRPKIKKADWTLNDVVALLWNPFLLPILFFSKTTFA